MPKLSWSGLLLGIQPRIDLTRSFDQRYHSYRGYLLLLDGELAGTPRTFGVRIGTAAQATHQFRAGDRLSGCGHFSADPEGEVADLFKASALKLLDRPAAAPSRPPPWQLVPPALEIYRERGHRRLDARTFEASCRTCQWGCRMPVEMIIDQWNPGVVRRRFETFCYGPKSCPLYRAGPARKVPGRRGVSYTEEDWVDEEATRARAADE